jgi:hypothetical protein
MKNLNLITIKSRLFIFLLFLSGVAVASGKIKTKSKAKPKAYTQLSVTNQTKDSVLVYVTFAAQNSKNNCCAAPAGLSDFTFLKPVKGNSLMGTFMLAPKSTKNFDPKGKCFSGNVGFYIAPQCQVKGADFHHGQSGTNIAEFTLNPTSVCDEAFDISCVNGVNCFMQVIAKANSGWTYGPANTPINAIYNRGLNENTGLPGVFPVNCTDCIRLVGPKPCPELPQGTPQKKRICNVQRSGRGGTVKVVLSELHAL